MSRLNGIQRNVKELNDAELAEVLCTIYMQSIYDYAIVHGYLVLIDVTKSLFLHCELSSLIGNRRTLFETNRRRIKIFGFINFL